jgi:hypothetical protein
MEDCQARRVISGAVVGAVGGPERIVEKAVEDNRTPQRFANWLSTGPRTLRSDWHVLGCPEWMGDVYLRGLFSVPDQPEEPLDSGDGIGERAGRTWDVGVGACHFGRRLEGESRVAPLEDDGAVGRLRDQRDGV